MTDKHKEYECCALYRPDLAKETLDAEVEAITNLITARGGEMARVDRWNKRFLAYPVKKFTEGFYVVYRWYSTKEPLQDLNYQLRFSENCLRHLVLDYTEKEAKRRKRLGKGKTSQV